MTFQPLDVAAFAGFLLLVVGYPAEDALVPDITKKPLDRITSRR